MASEGGGAGRNHGAWSCGVGYSLGSPFGLGSPQGFAPKEVSTEEAKTEVDFTIYLPERLPEGVRQNEISVMAGPEPEYKQLMVSYLGEGYHFTIHESQAGGEGLFGMVMPFPPGTKARKVEIGKLNGRVGTTEIGESMLVGQLGETNVQIMGNLEESDLLDVAKSLRAVK